MGGGFPHLKMKKQILAHVITGVPGQRHRAQNALRQGLLAKCMVFPAENEERFGPVDGLQLGLPQEMAASCRRMRRVRATRLTAPWNQAAPAVPNEPSPISGHLVDAIEEPKR